MRMFESVPEINNDYTKIPELDFLKRLRNHLVDLHSRVHCTSPSDHHVMVDCQCDIAKDHKTLDRWIYNRTMDERAHNEWLQQNHK